MHVLLHRHRLPCAPTTTAHDPPSPSSSQLSSPLRKMIELPARRRRRHHIWRCSAVVHSSTSSRIPATHSAHPTTHPTLLNRPATAVHRLHAPVTNNHIHVARREVEAQPGGGGPVELHDAARPERGHGLADHVNHR